MARPDFDPSDAIAFWDLTNTQDWHVCELQQRGTASRSWVSGRYSGLEESVHAFDQMVADRYAGDGVVSERTLLQRGDAPATDGVEANGHVGARLTSRMRASAGTQATTGAAKR